MQFSTWRTLKLGIHKSAIDLLDALQKDMGHRFNELETGVLNKISVAPTETEIELVNVSAIELGFKEGGVVDDGQVRMKANEIGLELLPAEAGPELRLQYNDQPMNEVMHIGTELVGGSYSRRRFILVNDKYDRRLNIHPAWIVEDWPTDDRWVFVRKQK